MSESVVFDPSCLQGPVVHTELKVRARLGECPRWDEISQCLYWVDIDGCQLNRYCPATKTNDIKAFNEEIGCFVLRKEGGFILATRSGFYRLSAFDGTPEFIADPEPHLPHNRFNDGRCDASGRFWAATIYPPKDYGGASLYSLNADFTVTRHQGGLLTGNGIAFSPCGKWLYYSDTPRHVIYRHPYDAATGLLQEREVFFQFPFGYGRPDGAAFDQQGCYWTALYEGGRVVRLSPEREILAEIPVPAKCPTMVAFGGEDLKTLYITSVGDRGEDELQQYPDSGSVFSVRVSVAGLVEPRF